MLSLNTTFISLFWFRRDLRLKDNAGLFYALSDKHPVLPLFIFDTSILDQLEDRCDSRVNFIYNGLLQLNKNLEKNKTSLLVYHGKPLDVFKQLIKQYAIFSVFANEDYEPYAIERDMAIKNLLAANQIDFRSFKDQVIFGKNDLVKKNAEPYTIYTPYAKAWKRKLSSSQTNSFPTEKHFSNFLSCPSSKMPSLKDIGFSLSNITIPSSRIHLKKIREYADKRDYPGLEGTSKLGVHFRFGTISIRKAVGIAQKHSDTWLNELIWREFFMMILYHFPHVIKSAFKKRYDRINWNNDELNFGKWCNGKTGYPLVDAGMRQLNATGFMHNRVRMVVASFLTKHLLIDWRWGEAYFGQKLLDYELSSNNGNWQWAAGCGCDAAPYFRIFNPLLQSKKFDPRGNYIKRWIPELETSRYPKPIINHEMARKRAIETYKKALRNP